MAKVDDLISRQAVIEAFDCSVGGVPVESVKYVSEYADKMMSRINALPSVQLGWPEWAHEVERWYNKALCLSYIKKPLAWALYQTWKEYDNE